MGTAVVWAKLDTKMEDMDGYLFARYDDDLREIVSISLKNAYLGVIYNHGKPIIAPNPLPVDKWLCVIVRMDGEHIEIFVNGISVQKQKETENIDDTRDGY